MPQAPRTSAPNATATAVAGLDVAVRIASSVSGAFGLGRPMRYASSTSVAAPASTPPAAATTTGHRRGYRTNRDVGFRRRTMIFSYEPHPVSLNASGLMAKLLASRRGVCDVGIAAVYSGEGAAAARRSRVRRSDGGVEVWGGP